MANEQELGSAGVMSAVNSRLLLCSSTDMEVAFSAVFCKRCLSNAGLIVIGNRV